MMTTTYSLVPTSTPLSGSSPPGHDSSSSGGNSIASLFSRSGSPPLILTFLAIGLLSVAISCLFGWRKLSRPQGVDTQPVTNPNPGQRSISLGKKPIFWDVWADHKPYEQSSKPINWDITPMTASLTFVTPSRAAGPLVEKTADPDRSIPVRMFRRVVSRVKRFYFPHSPPSSLSPPSPSPLPASALPTEPDMIPPISHTSEWVDASSLQLSVIIAMPTQREDVDSEQMALGLGDFCIGTMVVPWNGRE